MSEQVVPTSKSDVNFQEKSRIADSKVLQPRTPENGGATGIGEWDELAAVVSDYESDYNEELEESGTFQNISDSEEKSTRAMKHWNTLKMVVQRKIEMHAVTKQQRRIPVKVYQSSKRKYFQELNEIQIDWQKTLLNVNRKVIKAQLKEENAKTSIVQENIHWKRKSTINEHSKMVQEIRLDSNADELQVKDFQKHVAAGVMMIKKVHAELDRVRARKHFLDKMASKDAKKKSRKRSEQKGNVEKSSMDDQLHSESNNVQSTEIFSSSMDLSTATTQQASSERQRNSVCITNLSYVAGNKYADKCKESTELQVNTDNSNRTEETLERNALTPGQQCTVIIDSSDISINKSAICRETDDKRTTSKEKTKLHSANSKTNPPASDTDSDKKSSGIELKSPLGQAAATNAKVTQQSRKVQKKSSTKKSHMCQTSKPKLKDKNKMEQKHKMKVSGQAIREYSSSMEKKENSTTQEEREDKKPVKGREWKVESQDRNPKHSELLPKRTKKVSKYNLNSTKDGIIKRDINTLKSSDTNVHDETSVYFPTDEIKVVINANSSNKQYKPSIGSQPAENDINLKDTTADSFTQNNCNMLRIEEHEEYREMKNTTARPVRTYTTTNGILISPISECSERNVSPNSEQNKNNEVKTISAGSLPESVEKLAPNTLKFEPTRDVDNGLDNSWDQNQNYAERAEDDNQSVQYVGKEGQGRRTALVDTNTKEGAEKFNTFQPPVITDQENETMIRTRQPIKDSDVLREKSRHGEKPNSLSNKLRTSSSRKTSDNGDSSSSTSNVAPFPRDFTASPPDTATILRDFTITPLDSSNSPLDFIVARPSSKETFCRSSNSVRKDENRSISIVTYSSPPPMISQLQQGYEVTPLQFTRLSNFSSKRRFSAALTSQKQLDELISTLGILGLNKEMEKLIDAHSFKRQSENAAKRELQIAKLKLRSEVEKIKSRDRYHANMQKMRKTFRKMVIDDRKVRALNAFEKFMEKERLRRMIINQSNRRDLSNLLHETHLTKPFNFSYFAKFQCKSKPQ